MADLILPGASVLVGDCIARMKELPDCSVQMCVTSPPYFGLRDYGHDGQIGLEETPEQFIAKLVEVFREVRRVLADDGTLWVNIGDSYNAHPGQRKETDKAGSKQQSVRGSTTAPSRSVAGCKPKDLIGIPWMLAFALRADGWYLRQDIIWHKPNPMPESVTDRCTKAHEYVFLLSKSARYYYDNDAVREPHTGEAAKALARGKRVPKKITVPTADHFAQDWNHQFKKGHSNYFGADGNCLLNPAGRNRRSVWTIATRPYKGAHFAVFPPALVEPCILAGSRPGDTVLDPFNGSGTTGAVAIQHGRQYVGTELNPDYLPLTRERLEGAIRAREEVAAQEAQESAQADLFAA